MAHATPCVDLIAEERRELKIVQGPWHPASVRPVLSFTRSGGARTETDGGEQEGTRDLGARFRLIDARYCHLDVLIRCNGFGFQPIQCGVAKYAPPLRAAT